MSQYARALGIIKAREGKLLPKAKLHQLAESSGEEEFLRNLSDTVYGDKNSEIFSDDYYFSVSAEMLKIIKDLILEEDVKEIFLAENDLLNLRYVLKSILQRTEPPDTPLVPDGMVSYGAIKKYVTDGKYYFLPKILALCSVVLSKKPPAASPVEADMKIDEIFFSWAADKSSSSPDCSDYIKMRIDVVNILNLVKLKTFFGAGAWKPEMLHGVFLPGGTIDRAVFALALNGSEKPSEFFKRVVFFDYRSALDEIDYNNDFLASLSKFSEDAQTNFWKKRRLNPFGFHIVCGYVHAKKTEVKNLRMIFNALINRLPPDRIKSRLRESYI